MTVKEEDAMQCRPLRSAGLPLSSDAARPIKSLGAYQRNMFMCRARWMVTPYHSDEGSLPKDCTGLRWLGAAKAFFWLAAAVGTGLLLAGLNG